MTDCKCGLHYPKPHSALGCPDLVYYPLPRGAAHGPKCPGNQTDIPHREEPE